MAILFKKSNALLLLTPKTGSTWIRQKIKDLGIEFEMIGDPQMRDHDQLTSFDRSRFSLVGAFVRNPLDWYQSYWAYRMEKGWRRQYPLDEHCQSDDYTTFVRRAVSILPGALGNIYESYVGPAHAPIDFVGKQENLSEDFSRFLNMIGENADPAILQAGAKINATRTRPDYTEELKELITYSEWSIMERFGYLNERPDPVGLREMQARFPADAVDLRLLALWTESIHWEPDDKKKEAGIVVPYSTRYARIHSNYALFAQHKRKDLACADQRYQAALELDGRHPRTLCNYALFLWEHMKNPQQARTLMLRALAGRPMHPYTLGKLARLTHLEFQDPALAEIFCRQSLQANPRQAEVVLELVALLEKAGRNEEQRAMFASAMQAMPERQEIIAAYGRYLLTHAKAQDEALQLLQPVAERDDASRVVLLAYLFALQKSGSDAQTLAHWRQRLVQQAAVTE
ncbi:hypothetical protein [Acidovorax temperans]|uniref:hypothetical protein n=1 Tax=Acidovorax temperans TaxID=80878 RepID=UPI0035ADECBF